MIVFGLFQKDNVFGREKLIQLYLDEDYAFSQMHSRNLSKHFGYYLIKDLKLDETKNQRVLCPKRKDGII